MTVILTPEPSFLLFISPICIYPVVRSYSWNFDSDLNKRYAMNAMNYKIAVFRKSRKEKEHSHILPTSFLGILVLLELERNPTSLTNSTCILITRIVVLLSVLVLDLKETNELVTCRKVESLDGPCPDHRLPRLPGGLKPQAPPQHRSCPHPGAQHSARHDHQPHLKWDPKL